MLRLRTKASSATFHWDEGPMKAQWELTSDMDEEQIMNVLASMVRFVKAQPAPGQVIEMPLHVVPDPRPDPVEVAYERGYQQGQAPAPSITWAPAVKPVPLEDSLMAAQQSGFEPIPPGELED